jgi:hypothetical protein
LVTLIRFAAVVYLAFLVLWGLNYRRVPLEQRLDYDRARMTRESVLAFANRAVSEINVGYAGAHAVPADLRGLEYAFWDAEFALGSRAPTELGVPKRSLLTLYFRAAGVDGMTDPIFLEIIINPGVLDVERPMVVAHEWGHLAGYANESEASFIAWLACMRGDPDQRHQRPAARAPESASPCADDEQPRERQQHHSDCDVEQRDRNRVAGHRQAPLRRGIDRPRVHALDVLGRNRHDRADHRERNEDSRARMSFHGAPPCSFHGPVIRRMARW